MTEWLFFDVGYTLINENAVWERRCLEQAQTEEAVRLGLFPEDIYHAIEEASMQYKPQYRTVVNRYGFTEIAPYHHELEALYDVVPEVLTKLASNYKLGIIANQTDGLKKRLREAGIGDLFDLVISSWDYQVMKPDIRIFEIALEKAGCPPEKSIMIGDRLDNDIYPAKKAGMRTIWVRQGFGALQKPISEEYVPDKMVNSMEELPELLIDGMKS